MSQNEKGSKLHANAGLNELLNIDDDKNITMVVQDIDKNITIHGMKRTTEVNRREKDSGCGKFILHILCGALRFGKVLIHEWSMTFPEGAYFGGVAPKFLGGGAIRISPFLSHFHMCDTIQVHVKNRFRTGNVI